MCLQSPVVGRSQGQQQEKKQFDLLREIGSDIFAAPPPQSTATANFANFAHFNSHAGMSFTDDFAQDMYKSPRNIVYYHWSPMNIIPYRHITMVLLGELLRQGCTQPKLALNLLYVKDGCKLIVPPHLLSAEIKDVNSTVHLPPTLCRSDWPQKEL